MDEDRDGHTQERNPQPPHTYQLLIQVSTPREICVGRLGIVPFSAGYYVYTGSARRHLEARVTRHLSPVKTLHWHIDYLLTSSGVQVVGWRCLREAECAIANLTRGLVVATGFGSSDCRAGCDSHLKYLGPSARAVAAILMDGEPWTLVLSQAVLVSE